MKVAHIIIHTKWAPAPYLHIDKGMITKLCVDNTCIKIRLTNKVALPNIETNTLKIVL